METRRRKQLKQVNKSSAFETLHSDQSPLVFQQTILKAIQSPEGLTSPLLKSLYYLLIHLSSIPWGRAKKGNGLNELIMEIDQNGIRVTSTDICRLSESLSQEFYKRFMQLLTAIRDTSATSALGRLRSDTWPAAKELYLLLRCCLIVFNMLVLQQHLVENGRILLLIIRCLSLLDLNGGKHNSVINLGQLLTCEGKYKDSDCTTFVTVELVTSLSSLEQSDPCIPFLSVMLEVFIDELLVHGQLREHFKLIDTISSTEKHFMGHFSHGDIGIVIEVIFAHFSLSISYDQSFEDFMKRLSWLQGKDSRAPELSQSASISLLFNPIMLSAPKLMQAHIVSLVSETMGFHHLQPDLTLIDYHLSVFKQSVILYTEHMDTVQTDGHPFGAKGSFVKSSLYGSNFNSSCESYIQPATKEKINHLITKLDDSWCSRLQSMFLRTKSDLITCSAAFIKENEDMIDTLCRKDILSILSHLISIAHDNVNDIALQTYGFTSFQDICLLASLLKLMSSSLLHALWYLRDSDKLGGPKTLKNVSSSKEYISILDVLHCFREINLRLPIQSSLLSMMDNHLMGHNESKQMLLHFLGLLSLSFVTGLDFLVKGCIMIIMASMSLFAIEDGSLDAMRSLIDSKLESSSPKLPLTIVQEAVVDKECCLVVASEFQNIQALYLSSASLTGESIGAEAEQSDCSGALSRSNIEGVVTEAETKATCNGKLFLMSIISHAGRSYEDDLADFIECKQGKDYSSWLRHRQQYRKWKSAKMAVARWEKKKRAWKLAMGKRAIKSVNLKECRLRCDRRRTHGTFMLR
ncbi:hypothetical protein RJ639_016532 [Escallonia herrerae]|uniref:DUF7812 domain-containing protein n=1 Tax=Escallonia herrerae TaxID=1293975 RepID=A0AA89ALH1_9ASTE|nr:hypothetical protein RJ639_016532 [Escallonia herrerae]